MIRDTFELRIDHHTVHVTQDDRGNAVVSLDQHKVVVPWHPDALVNAAESVVAETLKDLQTTIDRQNAVADAQRILRMKARIKIGVYEAVPSEG